MREVTATYRAVPSIDGAGVALKRVIGHQEKGLFDPFLLLDHFGSDNPDDYLAGFPWHPHRGIETVTYLLAGNVDHGDSMRNHGRIGPGDAQWMTAGSGIIHQEMPQPGTASTLMEGFQLWVNLPASLKMTTPRYRAIEAGEIPRFSSGNVEYAVLAGEFEGHSGATPDLFVPVLYLIVTMDPGSQATIPVPASYNAAVYIFKGVAEFAGRRLSEGELGHLPGDSANPDAQETTQTVSATAAPVLGASFLFIAGKPLREPIAWGGPIVMNTRKELLQAFAEYDAGTFIKSRASGI